MKKSPAKHLPTALRFITQGLCIGMALVCFCPPAHSKLLADTREILEIITPDCSAASLQQEFGEKHVADYEIYLGEGESIAGTAIFPNDPQRRVEIQWKNLESKSHPERIRLRGTYSQWMLPQGIRLGMRLREAEQHNGKAFALYGFGWDYGGTVHDWQSGLFAQTPDTIKQIFAVFVGDTTRELNKQEADAILGDHLIQSNLPLLHEINPRIEHVIINFR